MNERIEFFKEQIGLSEGGICDIYLHVKELSQLYKDEGLQDFLITTFCPKQEKINY